MYESGFDDWDWPDELNGLFDAAEASIAARKAHAPEPLAELEALRTKLAAAEARNAALEAAMAPFADAAEGFDKKHAEDELYYVETDGKYETFILLDGDTLKLKHLMRADELLG